MIIDFIVYTIFTIYTAAILVFLESDWSQIITLIVLTLFFFYRHRQIDNKLIYFLALWCVINIISYTLNRSEGYKMITFLSISSRMLFAYLMVKIVGIKFFDGLFKYWFVLCLISFPFYVIECIAPSFVQSLAPKLNFMTGTEQAVKGGFYIFVYMHSAYASFTLFYEGIIRNCGFMWEPGAYAGVLVFMIIYQLFKTDFKIDWRILFLTICLLSTFSTAGYLSIFFIISFYFYYNRELYTRHKAIIPFAVIVITIISIYIYNSTPFLSDKIASYAESGTKSWSWGFQGEHVTRVTRWGIFLISLKDALVNPWGNGIFSSDYLIDVYHNASGPNSIAQILRQWGWIGPIALFYSLYSFKINNRKGGLIMLIPMSIILFSNPFHFRNLLYAIVFSVLCINDYKYAKNI